jgi:hypothetical protein
MAEQNSQPEELRDVRRCLSSLDLNGYYRNSTNWLSVDSCRTAVDSRSESWPNCAINESMLREQSRLIPAVAQ